MSTEQLTQCARNVLDAWSEAGWNVGFDVAMRAMREALAAHEALAAAPAEPVGWLYDWSNPSRPHDVLTAFAYTENQARANPIAKNIRAAYTHPAPQPQQASRLSGLHISKEWLTAKLAEGDDSNCQVGQPQQAGVAQWPNGCERSVPEALRFLASNERPKGGEQSFNAEHLLQLAREIEQACRLAAPPPQAPAPARQAQAVSQWLPIETAPKNGTELLVWWAHPTKDQPGVSLSHWLDNSKTATPWAGWALPKVIVPGMYVSHWMHKPGCPASPAKKKPG